MRSLPEHFARFEGDLYDSRPYNWSKKKPLRPNYERHHRDIRTVADLKATLRAGRFTQRGGYPLYFLASDGAPLAFDTVRAEFRIIAESIQRRDDSGWRVVACDINYEDPDLYCAHTNHRIESAYAEPEDTEEE